MKGSFRPGTPLDLEADAVVIGSGAGGASVADVLTRAGLSVVVVEEGGHVPASAASPRASEAFPQSWRCGGLTGALGRPPVAYAEGRCVGGGTEINSAIAQRVDPELLEEWARTYAIADFGADAVAPYLDRAEATVNASTTKGPLGAPSDILRRGAEALGWRVTDLKRGQRDCRGENRCALVCPNAAKQSMAVTLLPQAVARGARLLAHTRIDRLIVKGGRVAEIRGRAVGPEGETLAVRLRARFVFCCAGAIHTPALLLRSGLKHNVGRTLRMHPTIKATARFPDPVDAHLSRLPLVAVTEFMPDMRLGGSFFTPALFGLSLAEDWSRRKRLMPDWRHFGAYYGMIRPKGKGAITALPFAREPLVTYALAPEDRRNLRIALTRLGEAMFAAGATEVLPSITGHPGWRDPGELRREADRDLPAATSLMTIHLFSSCPPGEREDVTALDSFGRVRGLENLFVADASQIPEAPGVNPQMMVMAMAFRTAEAALASSSAARAALAFREAA